MDADVFLFILSTIALIVDYGAAGFYQLWLAGQTSDPDTRGFLIGKAGILLTGAAKDLFWFVLILAGLLGFSLADYPLLRHAATVLIVSLTVTAIINRRRWWRKIHDAAGVDGDPAWVLPEDVTAAIQAAEVALSRLTDDRESLPEQDMSAEALLKLRNVLSLYQDAT